MPAPKSVKRRAIRQKAASAEKVSEIIVIDEPNPKKMRLVQSPTKGDRLSRRKTINDVLMQPKSETSRANRSIAAGTMICPYCDKEYRAKRFYELHIQQHEKSIEEDLIKWHDYISAANANLFHSKLFFLLSYEYWVRTIFANN